MLCVRSVVVIILVSRSYGLSEKFFRKSVELHPTNAEAWLGLAASYDQLGLFKRSDRAYHQAIKLVGPKPAILNNQGYGSIKLMQQRHFGSNFVCCDSIGGEY